MIYTDNKQNLNNHKNYIRGKLYEMKGNTGAVKMDMGSEFFSNYVPFLLNQIPTEDHPHVYRKMWSQYVRGLKKVEQAKKYGINRKKVGQMKNVMRAVSGCIDDIINEPQGSARSQETVEP